MVVARVGSYYVSPQTGLAQAAHRPEPQPPHSRCHLPARRQAPTGSPPRWPRARRARPPPPSAVRTAGAATSRQQEPLLLRRRFRWLLSCPARMMRCLTSDSYSKQASTEDAAVHEIQTDVSDHLPRDYMQRVDAAQLAVGRAPELLPSALTGSRACGRTASVGTRVSLALRPIVAARGASARGSRGRCGPSRSACCPPCGKTAGGFLCVGRQARRALVSEVPDVDSAGCACISYRVGAQKLCDAPSSGKVSQRCKMSSAETIPSSESAEAFIVRNRTSAPRPGLRSTASITAFSPKNAPVRRACERAYVR